MGSCVSTQSDSLAENSLTLPVEIWLKILMYLKSLDLCRVAMVSKSFHKIVSDHTLWSGRNVKNISKIKNVSIAELFNTPRFRQIKCIDLSNSNLLPEQWSNCLEFLKSTRLEELTLCYVDLSTVYGYSLANCVSNLKKVHMEGTSLSLLQLEQIFAAISNTVVLEDLNLYNLIITDALGCSDRTEMASMMTKAICKLRSVNVSYTLQLLNMKRLSYFYTQETLIELFQSCLQSTTLKELCFPLNVSEVPHDLFSQVLCHLEKANFSRDFFTSPEFVPSPTSNQLKALLKQNLDSSMLKELTLYPIDLHEAISEVPPSLLSHSISKLEKISIPFCSLSDDQAEAIFSAPIHSRTLVAMNLAFCNLSNLQNIPQSIHHLQRLDLQSTKLSTSQTNAILQKSLNSTTLIELSLWNIEVSQVHQDLLSRALCRLRKVLLGCTLEQGGVTLDQCNHFLEESLSSTTLEHLTFFSESIKDVSPHLIGNAMARLKSSNLEFNDLSKEQVGSIFAYSIYSQTLVEVRLSHTNLNTLQNIPIHHKEILNGAKSVFCASKLLHQKVEKGRDWGRGPYDISNIEPDDEECGSFGVIVNTRIEYSEKGDYWSQQANGLVAVEWNNGNFSLCRMGRGDFYDVKLSSSYGNLEWLNF